MDIRDFIEQRLAEDEAWARAASQPYQYASDGALPPEGGVHWTWATGEHWTPTTVDPALDEFVGGPDHYGCNVQLRTVEEWPAGQHTMPATAATDIVEFRSTWAGHIVRHDPARVLRDVSAARIILDEHAPHGAAFDAEAGEECACQGCGRVGDGWAVPDVDQCRILRALASVHAGHPDWRTEWKP